MRNMDNNSFTELNHTSDLCRELAESNSTLKSRNDSLIHRLPSSRPSSPLHSSGSPYSSPSTQGRDISLPTLPGYSNLAPPRRRRHARHVSSTPAELALLADQNAELLTKLADLEAEATRSEQAGKRRLRALENEIETLREELERSRSESEHPRDLPQDFPLVISQDGAPAGIDNELVKLYKKLAREAKVRELKAKTRPWDLSEEDSTKDFAPKNLTPGLPFTSKLVSKVSSSLSPQSTPETQSSAHTLSSKSLNTLLSPTSGPTSTTPREQALVSQLLLKIRELEETNTQLAADQLSSRTRLRHAQTETESIRRLCEFISNEADLDLELEILDSDEGGTQGINDGEPLALKNMPKKAKTIRLRPVSRMASMDFGKSKSIGRVRRYSSVECFNEDLPAKSTNAFPKESVIKKRKPVSGLFDEWSDTSNQESSPLINPTKKSTNLDRCFSDSSYMSSKRSLNNPLDNDNTMGQSLEDELSGDRSEGEPEADGMPSLGSELGLQLQNIIPAPFHARTQSIAELLRVAEISSPISAPPSFGMLLPFPSKSSNEVDDEEVTDPKQEGGRRITNSRLRRVREDGSYRRTLSVASMPGGLEEFSLDLDNDSDSSVISTSYEESALHRPSTPTNNIPMTPTLTLTKSSSPKSSHRPLRHQPSSRLQLNDPKSRNKYTSLVVEIWLWLQFVVVIVVVVCAMARVGPKGVFRAPPTSKKNTH